MKIPRIIINFKSYREATGENALKLAKICESVSRKYRVRIGVAPSFVDLYRVSKQVSIPVFAQHIDSVESGAFTAHTTALTIKKSGAVGTFLNHSEHRLSLKKIKKSIQLARKNKLITIVFSKNLSTSKKIAKLNPDYIAYEPPELIGTGVSVSKTKPQVITKIVKLMKRVNPRVKVLTGAGVTTKDDVRRALELGSKGVLVASGVVKTRNPRKVLTEFLKS